MAGGLRVYVQLNRFKWASKPKILLWFRCGDTTLDGSGAALIKTIEVILF